MIQSPDWRRLSGLLPVPFQILKIKLQNYFWAAFLLSKYLPSFGLLLKKDPNSKQVPKELKRKCIFFNCCHNFRHNGESTATKDLWGWLTDPSIVPHFGMTNELGCWMSRDDGWVGMTNEQGWRMSRDDEWVGIRIMRFRANTLVRSREAQRRELCAFCTCKLHIPNNLGLKMPGMHRLLTFSVALIHVERN